MKSDLILKAEINQADLEMRNRLIAMCCGLALGIFCGLFI